MPENPAAVAAALTVKLLPFLQTSKVDTLRAAVDYIQALRRLVGEDVDGEDLANGPQVSLACFNLISCRGQGVEIGRGFSRFSNILGEIVTWETTKS